MRHEVTHKRDLEGFLCFLAMPFKGEEECAIYYPSMPDARAHDIARTKEDKEGHIHVLGVDHAILGADMS